MPDSTDRLAGALRELFTQAPRLQRRYRTAVRAMHPDGALDLVDAWIDFQQALTEIRYDPASAALLHAGEGWAKPRHAALPQRTMRIVAELSDARGRLCQALEAAEASAIGSDERPDRATVLARWRLLHRGERRLRHAVARAMVGLPAADHRRLRGLAPLAAGYTAYLDAGQVLARHWSATAGDLDPVSAATLDSWLSYATRLRDLLDQCVAGYGEPGSLPVAPWRSGGAQPQPGHESGDLGSDFRGKLRGELDVQHDGYPALIAGCRRVLAAFGGLDGPTAGALRSALLTAWGRYDDALADLSRRIDRVPAGLTGEQVAGARRLAGDLRRADELRAGVVDRLTAVEAWLAALADPQRIHDRIDSRIDLAG